MIGYPISLPELQALIEAQRPGWHENVAQRTKSFRTQGFYGEKSPNWSKIKPVYMALQGDCKCAYCERKLESVSYGKGEQDMEHFRPKNRVRPWIPPEQLRELGIEVSEVPREDHGYYLLPYHLLNYAASCKPCNSALKSDYFPVAGVYELHGDDPRDLMKEKPYLIYPIGDFDHPEELIHFHGVSPQATAESGHARARALVTIEFFKLDDETKRKNLLRERAMVIVALFPQLEKLADGATASVRADAQALVEGFTSPSSPHTNCALSFQRLFEQDRAEAKAISDRASLFLFSRS